MRHVNGMMAHDVSQPMTRKLDGRVRFIVRREHIQQTPLAWWWEQADRLNGGRCPRCRGITVGVYIPPSRATEGECGVAEHCRCGWEELIIAGRAGVPYPPGGTRRPLEGART